MAVGTAASAEQGLCPDTLMLSFTRDRRSGAVGLAGEIDAWNAAGLQGRVAELVRMPASHTLNVDLDALEFCDLHGLDAIVGLRELGFPTVLCGAPPHVRRLFHLAGQGALLG